MNTTQDKLNITSFKIRRHNKVQTYSCKPDSFLSHLGNDILNPSQEFNFFKQKKEEGLSFISINIENNEIKLNNNNIIKLPNEYSIEANYDIKMNSDMCYDKKQNGFYPVDDAKFVMDIKFKNLENPKKRGLYVFCNNGVGIFTQNGLM